MNVKILARRRALRSAAEVPECFSRRATFSCYICATTASTGVRLTACGYLGTEEAWRRSLGTWRMMEAVVRGPEETDSGL